MPPVHGSKAVFTVQDAGGVVRDLSGFLDSEGLSRSADTAEVTVGGNTSKRYIPGLKDGTIPIDGPWDATVDGYLNGILAVERNFVYNPAGNGAGLVTYTGAAILTSYEPDTSVDDAGRISGEFQVTGDVTRALQP
jgi:hypothetical protein